MTFQLLPTDALVIVDPQNDFCPGGGLAVAGGDDIMEGINDLAEQFATVVITQEYHPAGHNSFASTHGITVDFERDGGFPVKDGNVLWFDHCVQGKHGADFHPIIAIGALIEANAIIRKGMNPKVDSYSAFYENDKKTSTGLGGFLKARGVKRVFFVGLAYDFCVAYSALDAASREGLHAVVIKDLTRAIDTGGSVEAAENNFVSVGVQVINVADINVAIKPVKNAVDDDPNRLSLDNFQRMY